MKEELEKLIEIGEGFLNKNLNYSDSNFKAWNLKVVRFCETNYNPDSTTTKTIKQRDYCPYSLIYGATSKELNVAFESDLNDTLADLRCFLDEVDNQYYKVLEQTKSEANVPLVSVVNNISNNINIMTYNEVKEKIENDESLDDKTTDELLTKLDEIKELEKSNKSKKQKWTIAKDILAFILDKSVDVAIMYLPLIVKAIGG